MIDNHFLLERPAGLGSEGPNRADCCDGTAVPSGRLKEQLVPVLPQLFQVRFLLGGHWGRETGWPKDTSEVRNPQM